jgi:nitrate/nitrite-specific signal transduction histidine kinase
MRERARSMGGEIEIASGGRGGTRVCVRFHATTGVAALGVSVQEEVKA